MKWLNPKNGDLTPFALAWTLSTAAVFKARWERIGFIAMYVGLTICFLVFILAPEVFV